MALETTQQEFELVWHQAVDKEWAEGSQVSGPAQGAAREVRFPEQMHVTLYSTQSTRRGEPGDSGSETGVQSDASEVHMWLHEVIVWGCMVGLQLEPRNLQLYLF